jgi:hypothetical protein
VLGLLVGLVPLIIVVISVSSMTGAALYGRRLHLSDERMYWAQARAFAAVGLESGYFVADENPASIGPYYAWGAGPPVFYGTLARLVGWDYFAPVLINLISLAVAATVFAVSARLNKWQFVFLALLLITYPSLLLYAPTAMLQTLSIAMAFLLAAVFYRIIVQDRVHWTTIALTLFLIAFASSIRPTWAFLYVPLGVVLAKQQPNRWLSVLFVIGSFAMLSCAFLFYNAWASPFPYVVSQFTSLIRDNPIASVEIILDNARTNIGKLFEGEVVFLTTRLSLAIAVLYTLIVAAYSRWRSRVSPDSFRLVFVLIVPTLLVLVSTILLHDTGDWRDIRHLSPVILFSAILLLAFRHSLVIAALIGLSFVGALSIGGVYRNYAIGAYVVERTRAEDQLVMTAQQAYLAAGISYDRASRLEPWCNTVTTTLRAVEQAPWNLLALDDGLGWSPLIQKRFDEPLRARYVLVHREDLAGVSVPDQLVPLVELPDGTLFYNTLSACDPPAALAAP